MPIQNLEKEIKAYLKPTKRFIKLSHKHRKELHRQVLNSARQTLKERPEMTLEQLHKALGTPLEIAKDYRDEMGAERLQKSYRRSKWIITGVSVLCAIALVLAWYVIFVFVIPPDIDTYYLDAQGVYQLDENGSRVYLESAPEGAPEFYYE